MSLFAVYCGPQNDVDPGTQEIDPKTVNINGEVVGSFFSGEIEISYQNDTENVYEYSILFGNLISNVCIHDFKLLLDENPISLKSHENVNLERELDLLKDKKPYYEYDIKPVVYKPIRKDYLILKYVFPNQILKIFAEFEMPIQYLSRSAFEINFPLSYSGYSKRHILKCENFHFTCKFNSLPLKQNSITSNPEGKINLQESNYIIDHLDPEISQISILYDLNPLTFSKNHDLIQMQMKPVLFDDGYAFSCGKYASITFLAKKVDDDHFGEEFIFLIDCSKSMTSNDIELASQCLIYFLKSIPTNCFFNVIRFGSKHIPLFSKPVPNSKENVQKALDLVSHLKADLGETNFFKPLLDIFTTPLSKPNKLRHVFILTDGCVTKTNDIFDLVKQASSTTICNAIGLGVDANKSFVEEIGQKGVVDFILSSEDDIKEKVIGQINKNLNGKCNTDLSFGIMSNIDIAPPLSALYFNKPMTFFIKSSENLPDKFDIKIDVEGNDKPIIIHANSLSADSKINKTLEYLFLNQNLKYLSNSNMTEKDIRKIAQLSIKYNISSPYNAFSGVQTYKSPIEEEKMKELISDYETKRRIDIGRSETYLLEMFKKEYDTWLEEIDIFVKLINGNHASFTIPLNLKIEDLKVLLENETGLSQGRQRLLFAGRNLEDGYTVQYYGIQKYSTLHLVERLWG